MWGGSGRRIAPRVGISPPGSSDKLSLSARLSTNRRNLVIIGVEVQFHRLPAEVERLAEAAADWDGPLSPLAIQFVVISGDEPTDQPSAK